MCDSSGQSTPLALIVSKFDCVPEHEVLTRPHGNAKLINHIQGQRRVSRIFSKPNWLLDFKQGWCNNYFALGAEDANSTVRYTKQELECMKQLSLVV